MAPPSRLRIAYLCDISPLNRNLYSGGNARIYDALQKHAGDVTILGQGWHMAEPVRRLLHATPEAFNLRARWRLHLALSRIIAQGVRAELAKGQYDVLFGAYSIQSLYRVRPPYPMVTAFTSDATQTIYRASEVGQAFDRKMPGGALLDNWVERCERHVLSRTDLLLWPSEWLREAANARYGLDGSSAHLVPWGANLDAVPAVAPRALTPDGPVRLLLIGRDWFAKGGPIAFETMQILRAQGVDAHLTVVGCTPPDFHLNDHVTVIAQLDKSVPADLDRFAMAFGEAHFIVQPSFESYGFAFCEASAYGLPSLCLRVGGVPVRDGVNGYALPVTSTPVDFANRIAKLRADPGTYAKLCESTRSEYETHLNWDAWGTKVSALLRKKWDELSH